MIRARGEAIIAECSEQMPIAAEAFKAELLDVLNVQGSNDNRSSPGEAPRRQTGKMWKSVVDVPDNRLGVVYVGPTVPYARILLKTRPFYEITRRRIRDRLAAIVFEPARNPKPLSARPTLGRRIASFFTRRK